MIKGHTEIQLYKDGKMVQNTHDDNMLTNALANYFKNYGMVNPNAFSSDIYNDMITTLLGGILLLDTALPEQASLTHVPGGVLMVGNGAYGESNGSAQGDPTEMGSFNGSQSGWADANKTQFRMVWDFTTEQSNGTIACACLTSRAHGFIGEGNATSKISRSKSYQCLWYGQAVRAHTSHTKLYIDASDTIYTFSGVSNDHEISIYRQRKVLSSVDLRSTFDAGDSVAWKTFDLGSNAQSVGQNEIYYMGSDATNLYLYYNSGGNLLIITIPKTFSTATLRVIPYSSIPVPASSHGNYTWMTDGDYIYAFYNWTGVRFDFTTLNSDPITYDAAITNYYGPVSCCDDGGKIRFSEAIYDKTLNRMLKCNCSTSNDVMNTAKYANFEHPYKEGLYIDSGNDRTSYYPDARRRNDYIASINNLSTPVTKDNTQTMKVIYTLSFTG